MKVISKASESVLAILKRFLKLDGCSRWLRYCVHTTGEDGVLVFNLLTRELVHLSHEEYNHFADLDYLKEHWFLVPEETADKEYADLVKWARAARQSKPKEITSYTIFPTTDCNARCFYCFELGRSRIPMSCETANNVVQYIKNHCGGKDVKISWFGGEPLYNQLAIDTICQGLKQENISFKSNMVSNGYLFDDDVIKKAVEEWNLTKIQITLDGTEKVYNKIKAYIYPDENAYERVMQNIGKLLDAGIRISIRLNMDLHNADDLLVLTKELAEYFGGRKGLNVYAHHLFKGNVSDAELHSDEEWEVRDEAMRRLTDSLAESGLAFRGGIQKRIKSNHCMADSGSAVTILPDGHIGVCEHHSETEFIGHIDQEGFDTAVVKSWKERMPEIPECAECFYFLDCTKLKKCPNGGSCYRQFRQALLRKIQNQMINEYQRWLTKSVGDEEEDNDDC